MARKKLDTLTEQMYYLLLALHEPGHGYAIMERAGELSHGRLQLGPGTLYTLLGEAVDLPGVLNLGQNNKPFLLEPGQQGRDTLEQEYQRLRRQVADGAAIFGKEDTP